MGDLIKKNKDVFSTIIEEVIQKAKDRYQNVFKRTV